MQRRSSCTGREKDLASKHIPLLKMMMYNGILTKSKKWCLPVLEKMHELLLTSSVIHADETPVQVLHEEGRKATTESKMWVYCNGKMNDRSIVIFDYQPTRKGANAQEFLQDFHGYLVRDGFSGYHKVTGVKHVACMIHVRRAFVNAMPSDKPIYGVSYVAEAVKCFDRIYHEESLLKEMTAEDRKQQRLAKIKPLLDELFAWLETIPISGNGNLAKTVNYLCLF